MPVPREQVFGLCGCGVVAALLLAVYSAWSVLEPWEMGLNYSMISQSISEEAWGPGRHYLGIGRRFLRFNSTVTTVQFSHQAVGSSGGPLRSRTADGLEVMLELSFQYLLIPDKLHSLYMFFGSEFRDVFVKMGMDLLTMAATKHVAREFFVNRTMIGNMMEESLRHHFKEVAGVDVPLFQFQAVSLPSEFENAIKATQVAEQKIKRVQAEQAMREVEYETEVIQAQRFTAVRRQQAEAIANSIALRNEADVNSYRASQERSAEALTDILKVFGNNTGKLLDYMKVRAMRDHPASHSIVGIRDSIDIPGSV